MKRMLLAGTTVMLSLTGAYGAEFYNEVGGVVVMEAENTSSPLDRWEKKSDLAGYAGSGE